MELGARTGSFRARRRRGAPLGVLRTSRRVRGAVIVMSMLASVVTVAIPASPGRLGAEAAAAVAPASRWTWEAPSTSGGSPEFQWTSPDGSAWFTTADTTQAGIFRHLTRIAPDGTVSFNLGLPAYIFTLTFDAAGTAYAAGLLDGTTYSIRLYAVTAAGAVSTLQDFNYDGSSGPVSIQHGPDARLYLQIANMLYLVDPVTGSSAQVELDAGAGTGPVGAFLQTGTDALHFYDYGNDHGAIRQYDSLATGLVEAPPTQLSYARPSIAADGSLLVTGYISYSGPLTACAQVHAERFAPSGGVQFDVSLAEVLGGVTTCQLFGAVALPNGGSAIALLVDADAAPTIVWLDAEGHQTALVQAEVPAGWNAYTNGDVQVDDNGRVVLAYTVAGSCADDVFLNLLCSRVLIRAYDAGVLASEASIDGDGVPGSDRRFVRVDGGGLESASLTIGDGYVLIPTAYEGGDCGASGCSTPGNRPAEDGVPLDVKRPTWKDPTKPSPGTPPPSLVLTATPSSQIVGDHVTLLVTGVGPQGTLARFQVMSGPDTGFTAIIAADAEGAAATVLRGRAVGVDFVTAWVDRNQNGILDNAEPAGSTAITWSTPPFKYVALGDSYSAGEGVEPFFDPLNKCHRSQLAYATNVEQPGVPGVSVHSRVMAGEPRLGWGFQACSGATTASVLTEGHHADPLPQLALDRRGDVSNPLSLPVDHATNLVTITVGGNNVQFSDVLAFCYFSKDCTKGTYRDGRTLAQYFARSLVTLAPQLDAVYSGIRAQAPTARVLVLGYPQLFPRTAAEQNCTKLRQVNIRSKSLGFSRNEQQFVRSGATALNALIRNRAAANGVEFVQVDRLFAGHEPCGSEGEWMNGPSYSISTGKANDQSFHPNSCGQDAFAVLVNLRLNAQLRDVRCTS